MDNKMENKIDIPLVIQKTLNESEYKIKKILRSFISTAVREKVSGGNAVNFTDIYMDILQNPKARKAIYDYLQLTDWVDEKK